MSDLLGPKQDLKDIGDFRPSERSRHIKSILAVLLALAVLVGGGFFAFNKISSAVAGVFLTEDYDGPGRDDVEIEVPSGATVDEIATILMDADVVASTEAFTKAANESGQASQLQAGSYVMKTQMKAEDAFALMLESGVTGGKRFLIREGLRLPEQVAALAEQTEIPAEEFERALENPEGFGLPAMADGKAEGYLFPDTYEMSGNDPNEALRQMTANFQRKADEIQLEARAEELGFEPGELVTIASIIEAEVRRPEDRAKVARVIYNRLEANPQMRLQMDSTVHYVKGTRGGVTTSDADRADPSPYNTYFHTGLPPGPIGAPGQSSLEAAANPEDGDWLYFVSINMDTGETVFARTFTEHQQNVVKFQAWCQANPGKC